MSREISDMSARFAWRFVAACVASAPALAQESIAEFYRGKTLRLMVGASVGGGYDLVARLVASRFGAHLPGNPAIVVQNIPAASGLTMANVLYNIAPQDGTTIGLPTNVMALEPRLKVLTRAGGSVSFDATKFAWLGTVARLPQVLYAWRTSGVRVAGDLKTRKLIVAALSVASDSYVLPLALNNMLGAKIQIVPGYEGHADTSVAIERGEVHGYSNSFASLMANNSDWVRDGKVDILVQFGRERLPQLPDVPTAVELAENPLDREALRFYATKYDLAYALIAPPGAPAERVAALRAAFDATMRDPQFREAARRIQIPDNPLDGAAVARIIADIDATPQNVVDRMRELMTPP